MDFRDIRTQLLINTKDLDTFKKLYQIDKLSQDICRTESFWRAKYDNNFNLNILEYQYSLDCYERASDALNIISFDEDNNKIMNI